MTLPSAHWNRNQSIHFPADSQFVPTYQGNTLCVSSFAIAYYTAGLDSPLPAVASLPVGQPRGQQAASCPPFIVIAISVLILTVRPVRVAERAMA